jgi:MFS family permease
MARARLGQQFGWLWASYAVSAYGSGLGFGAFALIAIGVLHASPAEVSALPAASLAAGALVATPTGPWIETHRKRPVMIATDLARFAAMATIPIAYWLGWLTYPQVLLVAVVVAAAKIAFATASGAYLKSIVGPDDLLVANARLESTTWSSMAIGPPLGGAAIGVFGYVITVVADGLSYLFSALGITAIRGVEPAVASVATKRANLRDLPESWRYLVTHPRLRGLFLNRLAVGGLILAPEPLIAVLMLRQLHFAPWQYGLAFAVPCLGGVIGSRLARRAVGRYGEDRVLWVAGTAAAVWPVGLAFIPGGTVGLLLVIAIEFGVIVSMSVFAPVLATLRLRHTAPERLARTLSAWSITTSLTTALLTVLWGVLATVTTPRIAMGIAGLLLLATPALLPRRQREPVQESRSVTSPVSDPTAAGTRLLRG